MYRGALRDGRGPGVDADGGRRSITGEAVQDPHPQHCLGLGHVVPEQRDHVGVVHIGVRTGLPVTAERLFECLGGNGGAQPGVAVHVICSDRRVSDHTLGVVLLEEQLPGGVKADATGTVFVEQRLAAPYHLSHRGVPIGGDKRAVAAYQRGGEPVGRRVSLPAVQVLRVDPSAGVRP